MRRYSSNCISEVLYSAFAFFVKRLFIFSRNYIATNLSAGWHFYFKALKIRYIGTWHRARIFEKMDRRQFSYNGMHNVPCVACDWFIRRIQRGITFVEYIFFRCACRRRALHFAVCERKSNNWIFFDLRLPAPGTQPGVFSGKNCFLFCCGVHGEWKFCNTFLFFLQGLLLRVLSSTQDVA